MNSSFVFSALFHALHTYINICISLIIVRVIYYVRAMDEVELEFFAENVPIDHFNRVDCPSKFKHMFGATHQLFPRELAIRMKSCKFVSFAVVSGFVYI